MACRTGRKSGSGISVEIFVPFFFSPFWREEKSCGNASTTAAESGGEEEGLTRKKSASLGSEASLVQVPLRSYKSKVAFGSVSEESRWWNVLKHTRSRHELNIRWINIKYGFQGTETLFPLSQITAMGPRLIPLGNPEYLRGTGKIWNLVGNLFIVKPLSELVREITQRHGAEPGKTDNKKPDVIEDSGDKLF